VPARFCVPKLPFPAEQRERERETNVHPCRRHEGAERDGSENQGCVRRVSALPKGLIIHIDRLSEFSLA